MKDKYLIELTLKPGVNRLIDDIWITSNGVNYVEEQLGEPTELVRKEYLDDYKRVRYPYEK